ncbi:MAG TPA: alcohol dehydrogenase catalytic domain-containing protein [Chloroflexota bacterium]|nr:alcohol dehydrogenase catalytic domain-containing protein [Chloroflexota bacterium]
MRAIVTRPGAGRAWLAELPEPTLGADDEVLVEILRVGVCGTDRHVMNRDFSGGRGLPAGDDYLIVGHEAVGRVLQTGAGVRSLKAGDLVVPTVRRGCPGCPACDVGQADLCFTGNIRERGIVGLHGFLAERIVDREPNLIPVPPELAIIGPLVESLCTPEKALRRIANARAHLPVSGAASRDPNRDATGQTSGELHGVERALVTGSGPIALLAVMALRLRGIATWQLARQPTDGLAADLARRVGATYVALNELDQSQPQARLGAFDAIIEATGAGEMSVLMVALLARNGVLDLVGGPSERHAVPIPASSLGGMVGKNLTVLGSVNANAADWQAAVRDLTAIRQTFDGAAHDLITHTFKLDDVDSAFERVPGQIKAVVDVAGN